MPSRASHPASPQQLLPPDQRLPGNDPNITHNDVARWRCAELLPALGCGGWFDARVTTCGEFDHAAVLQRPKAGQCRSRTQHNKVIPFRALQN
jgi:hypothetical protein